MRIGIGFDFHRLVKGRKLIIGGINVPFTKGLLGWSDGDVLLHAIGDAILGANGERDIGYHFPDTDPKYKGISSLVILKEIMKITDCKIINIDSVVICGSPKLSEYIPQMIKKIANALKIPTKDVSVKAKTHEGMGPIGESKGISAYSVVLLRPTCKKPLSPPEVDD